MAAKLKVLMLAQIEAGARARPLINGVSKVFFNQFGILGLIKTGITMDELQNMELLSC